MCHSIPENATARAVEAGPLDNPQKLLNVCRPN